LAPSFAHARNDDRFTHRIDTATFAALRPGPQLQRFISQGIINGLRTDCALSPSKVNTANCRGVLLGLYPASSGAIDLTLPATIDRGALETPVSLDTVDAAVAAWTKDSPGASVLKDLRPVTVRLGLHDGEDFLWKVRLARRFRYELLLTVAYDAAAKTLEDTQPELRELKKFIASAESDARGRVILQNNTSGLPAEVEMQGHGATAVYHIHHPMHDIAFAVADKRWNYAYSGELATFARFAEIKRALSNANVAAFVGVGTPVRVTVSGGPKTYFDCRFYREDGTSLRVQVEGKNVKTWAN
jgi:hypothetical protein